VSDRTEGSVFTQRSDTEERVPTAWLLVDRYVVAPGRIVLNDIRGIVGGAILLTYVLMGTVGVVVVPSPQPYKWPTMVGPFQNLNYPLGTDNLGVSLLTQIVHATPAMFKMIAGGALFTVIMGTIVGVYAGYSGGLSDRLLSTFTDIMITIPGLPLIIVISVIYQPRHPFIVGIVLSINAWAGLARALRSEVLSIREESYVEASQTMGIPTSRIIVADIMPNLMSFITINFVNAGRRVIFSSVALYFLGILPFSSLNWGVIMNLAYRTGSALSTLENFYWFAIPTTVVVLLSVGLVLLAQSLDQVFNPRTRARHSKTIKSDD
jgi:peptide/nickel transport system permease protein